MNRFLCVVCACIPALAQVTLTPSSPPLIQQGQTFPFAADQPVTWSLAPGSPGFIDPDGTYHAPASVVPNQSIAGCQIFTNTAVYNVPVNNLPKHPQSDDFIAWTRDHSGGNNRLIYSPAMPLTFVSGDQPTRPMRFYYTPNNDGPFPVPQYPLPYVEGGYWGGGDRHVILVDHENCKSYEMFSWYIQGNPGANPACPSCNAQSGAPIDLKGDGLLVSGGTDVASLPLTALLLRPDELKAGAINHALRVTLNSPRSTWVWPALYSSSVYTNDPKAPPVGTRFRLKASFDISPFSPTAQVILTALQKYGIIVADRGYNWNVIAAEGDYDDAALSALNEIFLHVTGDELEAVDESGLMLDSNSAETNAGQAVVIATSTADSAQTAQVAVRLFGVAVSVPRLTEAVQAGATKQLTAWVGGATDNSVTWTMNPTLGSLDSSGLYTAPDDVAAPQTITATATSNADPTVSASVTLTVLPQGPIRINSASTSDYVDSQGNTWWADAGYHGGYVYSYPDLTVTGTNDAQLYRKLRGVRGDFSYSFAVPNGNYKVTVKTAEPGEPGPGKRDYHLESQGQIIYRDVDPFAASGGIGIPLDFDMPAVVTDGTLTIALRVVSGDGPILSALQITPDPGAPRLTVSPADGGRVTVLQSRQFHAVAWYLENSSVMWSISPAVGSIDANGVYTGPTLPVLQPTVVTVTATSTVDSTLQASAVITVLPGIPDIRVNSGDLPGFMDAQGHVWSPDYGAVGGVVFSRNDVTIAGTTPDMQSIYQSARYLYDNQSFYYSFPEPNGVYQVTLKFAGFAFSDSGHHLFDVLINGQPVLTNFDEAAAAGGGRRAHDRVFATTVTNGVLRIDFIGHAGGAMINGIQIVYVPEVTLGDPAAAVTAVRK
jgi:hypothetical protein